MEDVVEYRDCRLVIAEEDGGYRVRIQPHQGTKVQGCETMKFERRADAVSDARDFIDHSLA